MSYHITIYDCYYLLLLCKRYVKTIKTYFQTKYIKVEYNEFLKS